MERVDPDMEGRYVHVHEKVGMFTTRTTAIDVHT